MLERASWQLPCGRLCGDMWWQDSWYILKEQYFTLQTDLKWPPLTEIVNHEWVYKLYLCHDDVQMTQNHKRAHMTAYHVNSFLPTWLVKQDMQSLTNQFLIAWWNSYFAHSPQLQHHWAAIHQTPGCAAARWCGSPQTQLEQQQDPQQRWWSQTAGKGVALAGGGLTGCSAESGTQHRAGRQWRRHSTRFPRQQTSGWCPGSP